MGMNLGSMYWVRSHGRGGGMVDWQGKRERKQYVRTTERKLERGSTKVRRERESGRV